MLFLFNGTATTEIYTLSLHDALPICAHLRRQPGLEQRARRCGRRPGHAVRAGRAVLLGPELPGVRGARGGGGLDRKSTRLNFSHANIPYAVFCLKKKKTIQLLKAKLN